jgi:hypothetical protein
MTEAGWSLRRRSASTRNKAKAGASRSSPAAKRALETTSPSGRSTTVRGASAAHAKTHHPSIPQQTKKRRLKFMVEETNDAETRRMLCAIIKL